ncbi:hypothetical protein BG015_005467 [Linnemannia schmuckeri]|uniref:Centromere protein Chl4/mis15/CENP-N n=1 Tax=Linnemannia schmuckeri TaxID=64567 RepID=A0A9P5UWW2_9FUNG|nr:hypothetical protein BG015_005467 [Linnemannia schmuckeri]
MDGHLFPDSPSLRRTINRHTKEALIDTAIRWVTIHAITRVQEDASDEEDYFDEFIMELDERPSSLRTMSLAKYKKHIIKRYELMRDKPSSNRKKVIDRMLAVDWRTGLNSSQVAELDLTYYSQHPNLKNWKALKLDYGDSSGANTVQLSPLKIEKSLSHHLDPYFKNHIQTLQDGQMIWIRISIHDGLAPNVLPVSSTVVYLIWFTNSEYILTASIKKEWVEFIMEAIMRVFKAEELEEWPLTGNSPKSLSELLLQKDSQGAQSIYRLNQLDSNPLSGTTKKRKLEDPRTNYAQGMEDIQSEDMNKIVRRDLRVAKDFGPNDQPNLSRVDIQLNLPYTEQAKDFELGRLNRQPFPVKVIFEGSNVIEGIKSLIPLGVATEAMPKFLTNLHSMATNKLTVDLDEDDEDGQRITKG